MYGNRRIYRVPPWLATTNTHARRNTAQSQTPYTVSSPPRHLGGLTCSKKHRMLTYDPRLRSALALAEPVRCELTPADTPQTTRTVVLFCLRGNSNGQTRSGEIMIGERCPSDRCIKEPSRPKLVGCGHSVFWSRLEQGQEIGSCGPAMENRVCRHC